MSRPIVGNLVGLIFVILLITIFAALMWEVNHYISFAIIIISVLIIRNNFKKGYSNKTYENPSK